MPVSATTLNTGDVIIYNTNKYTLILVPKKEVDLLPKSKQEVWKSAEDLVEQGKARRFEQDELTDITKKLAQVILLIGEWPESPPSASPPPSPKKRQPARRGGR